VATSAPAGEQASDAQPGGLAVFWALTPEELQVELGVSGSGLSTTEAATRLNRFGPNTVAGRRRQGTLRILARQFLTPIVLILIAAAILSGFLGDAVDAYIILTIVLASGLLSFWQERGAENAVAHLLEIVAIQVTVVRDGAETQVPAEDVVPGDIVALSAGGTVPADCLLLESRELFVDESALTGETFPVEKEPGAAAADAPLARREGALFMGTHVVSGTGRALVACTGRDTQFGAISARIGTQPEETEFEHGVRHFGYLLMEVTLLLVLAIFALNVYLHRPVLDSFLFALALAVGLTPQLLPAIISVNLAHGARRMADRKVIVKRLAAIEDFGSMNVLCSDKTGTLTEGKVAVDAAYDTRGNESDDVLLYAYINSSFETGFHNPIDEALRQSLSFDVRSVRKLDEEPYDFLRKRLSVLVERDGTPFMVTKGSVATVLDVCTRARVAGGLVRIAEVRPDIQRLYESLSGKGLRTLGVAIREDVTSQRIEKTDEADMVFVGLVAFADPAKADAAQAVAALAASGIELKIITGDNKLVARTLGAQMGIEEPDILTGSEIRKMRQPALVARVRRVAIFAEIEPNQKEHIIRLLRKAGNVVGYLGDGINDASALHSADVGISVASAVDVAKDAADIVLLEQGLDVLSQGVADGRATFANTLKYVFMATSANFGNMFSMAGASLFLPFLPLLPKQILLTNLLTDFPEMTIATDSVDPELVSAPRRWDITFIRDFMIVFGLLSSVFDYATFAVLLLVLHAGPIEFRTGWFTESVLSASMVVLVIRTRRPFLRSRPGKWLVIATAAIAAVVLALPFTPLGTLLGFRPLPASFLGMLALILAAYIGSAEVAKAWFYRRHPGAAPSKGRLPGSVHAAKPRKSRPGTSKGKTARRSTAKPRSGAKSPGS
jgi:P-type Mg2+ transporter